MGARSAISRPGPTAPQYSAWLLLPCTSPCDSCGHSRPSIAFLPDKRDQRALVRPGGLASDSSPLPRRVTTDPKRM